MWPKHGELRNGERYDRPSMAWIRADEWQVRQWEREDRVFAKMANQGEVCCPSIVTDGTGSIHGIQSMGDGKFYDSKSALRAHYKRDGLVEIGNDSWLNSRPAPKRPDRNEIKNAVGKAIATVKEMPEEVVRARARARSGSI
jgi:hypothetical protein